MEARETGMEATVHWRIRLNSVHGARLYGIEKLAWLTVLGHYLRSNGSGHCLSVRFYEGLGLIYLGRIARCGRASLCKADVQRLREHRERLDGKYIVVSWSCQVDLKAT